MLHELERLSSNDGYYVKHRLDPLINLIVYLGSYGKSKDL